MLTLKIVGLQAGGDWVIQKDYVQLVPNQQIYEILWVEKSMKFFGFHQPEMNNMFIDPWSFGGIAVAYRRYRWIRTNG
jgi:hypothetical protein